MFNASKTLARTLHSVIGQSFQNWKIILIDDVSTPDHKSLSCNIIDSFLELDEIDCSSNDRIHVIWNNEKKWEVENVLQGLKLCNDEDIICRLDADDFLTDLDALRIINDVYNQEQCETLWTSHRWHSKNQITHFNISGPFTHGSDPYKHPWVSSHFKTFRKRLLNNVKDENYRDEHGQYFKRIGDQTFMIPAIYHSKKNLFLPVVMYSYYCDMSPSTFQSEDAKYQKAEAEFLRKRGYVK